MNESTSEQEVVSVFEAPNEIAALAIKDALQDAGIDAMIRSRQVPWLDGVMSMVVGYWGDVMTAQHDCDRAKITIESYLAETKIGDEPEIDTETEPEE